MRLEDMQTLTVAPLGVGWAVSVPGVAGPMMFQSGGAAETAARRLAERLSVAGTPAKLLVHLKNGALAGRFLFPPRADSEAVTHRAA
jgi:hypothetical protein